MKKAIIKGISAVAVLALAVMICIIPVSADNATIKASSKVYLGDTFSVSVTCSCDSASGLGAIDGLLSFNSANFERISNPADTNYDASQKGYVISYAANPSDIKKSVTFTFKFKALKEGKDSIVISADITSFDEASTNKKENRVTISVLDKSKLSSNADLKSLVVSSGKLDPVFNPKTTKYTVNVPNSVTNLYIKTETDEAAAGLEVTGTNKLTVGNNTRKIIVTAPNGTKKTYTVEVYRAKAGEDITSKSTTSAGNTDSNPYKVIIDNKEMQILNDFSNIAIPSGFKQTYISYNSTEVPALIDPINNKTLVYLVDAKEDLGNFYVFDSETNGLSLYRYFSTNSARYVILDYADTKNAPDGYFYTTTEISGYPCGCFKYSDQNFANFLIIYCETKDGLKGFYRYDKTDGSMQRAKEFSLLMEQEKNKEKAETMNVFQKFSSIDVKGKIIVIAVLVVFLLLIALVVFAIVKSVKASRPTPPPPPAINEQPNFLEGVDDTRNLYLGDFDDETPNK